ncbi:MAG: transcriptional regulator [Treponema sp.]|nr:transcriptional regulator [Treponema sp.]MDE6245910.1 trp operon repressor [Treponemataceae bacterium]MBD5404285.1 transcriptional regulator [Treponema sp.]MBD5406916.1 transcriptional regulator [Treponema sp.]MBD5408288.1 transcriptional regulator [Treponema sp.]
MAEVDWQDEKKLIELEKSYKEVCALIAATSDKDFLMDFFSCLFTKSERKNIAERWLLVKEISSGLPQREIAKKYNMSLCKITRGSKELKRKNSAFLKMLELAEKDK